MHNYFLYKPWIVWALTESAKIPAKWRIASGSGETGWSCSEFGFRLCVDSRICRAKATRLFGSRQSRSDNIWPDSEMARIGFLSEVDFWSRPRQVCKMVRSATCVNKKYNFFLKKTIGIILHKYFVNGVMRDSSEHLSLGKYHCLPVVNLLKHFTIVIYNSRVVLTRKLSILRP